VTRLSGLLFFIAMQVALTACDNDTSAEDRISKAVNHFQAGEPAAALIELKNALQQEPGNARARWLLGQYYYSVGDFFGAVSNITKAVSSGYTPDEAVPLLAKALLEINDLPALGKLETATLNDASRAQVLASQSLGDIRMGESERAGVLVEAASSLDGDNTYVRVAKLRLANFLNEVPEDGIRREVAALLEVNPADPYAWRYLGELEQRSQQFEAAEAAFSRAIDNGGSDYVARAAVRIELENYSGAKEDIEAAGAGMKDHPDIRYLAGVLAFKQGNLEEAKADFEAIIANVENYDPAHFYLGMISYKLGDYTQAQQAASRYNANNPGDLGGAKLLAAVAISGNEFLVAENALRPFIESGQIDDSGRLIFATSLLRQGKIGEASEVLGDVSVENLGSPEETLQFATASLLAGKEEAALRGISAAIDLAPDFYPADELLIAVYLSKGETQRALDGAKKLVEKYPQSASAWNMVAKTYLASGTLDRAIEALKKATDLKPGDQAALTSLAQIAINNKEYSAAEKYLQEILRVDSAATAAYTGLAQVYALQGQEQKMVEALNSAREANPAALQPRLILAQHFLAAGKPEESLALVSELSDQQKRAQGVVELRAKAALAMKDYPSARTYLEQWSKSDTDNPEVYFLLAKAYSELGEAGKVRESLNKALESNPGYVNAMVGLARLNLFEGRNDEFREQLEKLNELAADHPSVIYLNARNLASQGKTEEAVKLLDELFLLEPTKVNLLALVEQMEEFGDHEVALKLQNEWLRDHPSDVGVLLRVANYHDSVADPDMANEYYKKVLAVSPDDLIALNNLSWNLREKNPEKALDYAKAARNIAPKSKDIADTYAVVLMHAGNLQEARDVIQKTLESYPKDPNLLFHGAEIEASLGNNQQAIEMLEELLKSDSQHPQADKARELLRVWKSKT